MPFFGRFACCPLHTLTYQLDKRQNFHHLHYLVLRFIPLLMLIATTFMYSRWNYLPS